jgi:hypothetical protein
VIRQLDILLLSGGAEGTHLLLLLLLLLTAVELSLGSSTDKTSKETYT